MWGGLGGCAPPPGAQQQSRSRAAVHNNTMNRGTAFNKGVWAGRRRRSASVWGAAGQAKARSFWRVVGDIKMGKLQRLAALCKKQGDSHGCRRPGRTNGG